MGNNIQNLKQGPTVLRDNARLRIDRKIDILIDWYENEIPFLLDPDGNVLREPKSNDKIIDYYPRSVNAFLKWTDEMNSTELPYKFFSSTLRTLNEYGEKKEEVRTLITRLIKKADVQMTSDSSIVKELDLKLKTEYELRKQDDYELTKSYQRIKLLKKQLLNESSKTASAKLRVDNLENEIQELRDERNRLQDENQKLRSKLRQLENRPENKVVTINKDKTDE